MHSPEPTPTHTHPAALRPAPPFTSIPLSQHLELDHKPPQPATSSDPQQSVWYMKHPRDSAAGAVPLSLALSLGAGGMAAEHGSKKARRAASGGDSGGEFVCKTCNRAFGSFQALGGHRTSHLRGRHGLALGMPAPAPAKEATATKLASAATAPESHLCHVCGLGFEMGQALGGHMRRHREEAAATTAQAPPVLLQLFV